MINAQNTYQSAVFYSEFRHLDPERRREITTNRRYHEDHLESLIKRGQVEGSVRTDLDPRVTTLMTLSMMNSLHQWYRTDSDLTIQQLADHHVKLILGGIGTAP